MTSVTTAQALAIQINTILTVMVRVMPATQMTTTTVSMTHRITVHLFQIPARKILFPRTATGLAMPATANRTLIAIVIAMVLMPPPSSSILAETHSTIPVTILTPVVAISPVTVTLTAPMLPYSNWTLAEARFRTHALRV